MTAKLSTCATLHMWFVCLPNLIISRHISQFTCTQSDMLPVGVYSTIPSKKKKNLITWLTECSGGMSCGCELGWKRNIHKLNLSINSLTVWDSTLWVSGGRGVVCRMRIFLFIFWTRYFLEFGILSEAGKVGLRCGAPPAVQSIFKYVWALLSQYCWNCVNQNFQIP